MSGEEAAQVIERFLEGRSLYDQEWNDFVDARQSDKRVESCRRRCDELAPLVNCPGPQDPAALAELHSIIRALRSTSK